MAEDTALMLEAGTLLRCEARIGIARRMTAEARPAPNPLWNETLHLKLPHPTAVLEVSMLIDTAGDVDPEPWATTLVPLADLEDGTATDA